MGTVNEEAIGLHGDLRLNGLFKEIWEIVGREGGLKSVVNYPSLSERVGSLISDKKSTHTQEYGI
jgi:hypothetical protein